MTTPGRSSELSLRAGTPEDVLEIARLFRANRSELSLFQQAEPEIHRNLEDFVVAENRDATLLGCVALHWHDAETAEILGLSVDPERKARGVGTLLTRRCIELFLSRDADTLWLATGKPGFFTRLGFFEISMWELPLSVLWNKFPLVFQQPPGRWLPSLFGRHTFMKLDPGRYGDHAT